MAKTGINETQFAFTFFHHLSNLLQRQGIRFLFPTLFQEGDPNFWASGTDLVINGNIFIQFKMADYFIRKHPGKEIREELVPKEFAPYYRFNIKNEPISCQFSALQRLAQNFRQATICYVAPNFHNERGFWRFFDQLAQRALEDFVRVIPFRQFIEPTVLNLSEDNSHRICYSENLDITNGFLLSNPQKITVGSGLNAFSEILQNDPIQVDFGYLMELLITGTKILFPLDQKQSIGYLIRKTQAQLLNSSDIFWLPLATI